MTRPSSLLILFLAALLEAGGDAILRVGLHTSSPWHRTAFFGLAAVLLFLYGWTVNAPPWEFGKLLGIYVVFFFVVAQAIAWVVFKQTPGPLVLLGGLLILAGGVVLSLAPAS